MNTSLKEHIHERICQALESKGGLITPWHPLRLAAERLGLSTEKTVQVEGWGMERVEARVYESILNHWEERVKTDNQGGVYEEALRALPNSSGQEGREWIRIWFVREADQVNVDPERCRILLTLMRYFPWLIEEKSEVFRLLQSGVGQRRLPLLPDIFQVMQRGMATWQDIHISEKAFLWRLLDQALPLRQALSPPSLLLRVPPHSLGQGATALRYMQQTDPARFALLSLAHTLCLLPRPTQPLIHLFQVLEQNLTDGSVYVRIACAAALQHLGLLAGVWQQRRGQLPARPELPDAQLFWTRWLGALLTQGRADEYLSPILERWATTEDLPLRLLSQASLYGVGKAMESTELLNTSSIPPLRLADCWQTLYETALTLPAVTAPLPREREELGFLMTIIPVRISLEEVQKKLLALGLAPWQAEPRGQTVLVVQLPDEQALLKALFNWRPRQSVTIALGKLVSERSEEPLCQAIWERTAELTELAGRGWHGYVLLSAALGMELRRSKSPMAPYLRDLGTRSIGGRQVAINDLYHPDGIGQESKPGYYSN